MIGIIAVAVTFVLSLLWFIPQYKLQKNKKYVAKDYVALFIFPGVFFTCVLIIIFEITWDIIFKHINISNLSKELIGAFFRAALIEELFKFLGFRLAKKANKLDRKSDYMLIGGFIGLTYGIVEKAFLGNILGAIIGTMIPLHFIWQFNQAKHVYEYDMAIKNNDKSRAKKEFFLFAFIPFLMHGCWDAALTIAGYLIDKEENIYSTIGIILELLIALVGLIYVILSLKMGRKIFRDEVLIEEDKDIQTNNL